MIWGYYLISHDTQLSIVCEFPLIIKPLKEIVIVFKTRSHAWQVSHSLYQFTENKDLTNWNVSGLSYWENDLKIKNIKQKGRSEL